MIDKKLPPGPFMQQLSAMIKIGETRPDALQSSINRRYFSNEEKIKILEFVG